MYDSKEYLYNELIKRSKERDELKQNSMMWLTYSTHICTTKGMVR